MSHAHLTPSGVPQVNAENQPEQCKAGWVPTVDDGPAVLADDPIGLPRTVLLRYPPNAFRRLAWRLFLGVKWVPAAAPEPSGTPMGEFLVTGTRPPEGGGRPVRWVCSVHQTRAAAADRMAALKGVAPENAYEVVWSPKAGHYACQPL